MQTRARLTLWRSVRALPDFWRLLQLRAASQFGDGLFQAGLAGALLFNPERVADPWEVAGAFAVLFLPYSLLGPFAGALLDRWDRRVVLVAANAVRLVLVVAIGFLLAVGAGELALLCTALIANGFTRFVSSGLSAALPHVVPRRDVVTMNSIAVATGAVAAFFGAYFMLLPRQLFGAGDAGAATVIFLVALPVAVAFWLALRFPPRALGPDGPTPHRSVFFAVTTGWAAGLRALGRYPTVAATLSGLVAHRMAFGINTLLILMLVRHVDTEGVAGLGMAALFGAAAGGGSFAATLATPLLVRRWGRYASGNGALAAAALIQLACIGLQIPVLLGCGFLLGMAGQTVKLCADSAMQIDVDDSLRGHVFTVQDALFWVSFVTAIAAAASVMPADGRAPALVPAAAAFYLLGLASHAGFGRSATRTSGR
ncbi:MFS transporter [Mycobacterium sp. 1274756.6]|uniref:MFS transporter n=1 Tax=Mycobacterium sp. 1274756.6 TaxID=1834076 RepID=UPI000AD0C5D6|nr:MFS transporter [Mycobacterium sp. 1274756.6]